ncbi:MAG: hypothetical protein PVI00_14065 [Desulfobacterales bacterium]|jgi:hypothetical protein
MAHQNLTRAVTGLVLVFVKAKGFAGQVILQLAGGGIDYIEAGIPAFFQQLQILKDAGFYTEARAEDFNITLTTG